MAHAIEIGKSKLVPGLVQETLDEGNAPSTQAFADEIGADIYTKDAASAGQAAKALANA